MHDHNSVSFKVRGCEIIDCSGLLLPLISLKRKLLEGCFSRRKNQRFRAVERNRRRLQQQDNLECQDRLYVVAASLPDNYNFF